MTWLLLAVAGGAGACARWWVDARVTAARAPEGAPAGRVPVGTVVVNLTACLLLGLLTGAASAVSPAAVSVLGTGLLGGYSTFSTAALEGARLVLEGRWGAAVAHAGAMTLGTVACAWAGVVVGTALV